MINFIKNCVKDWFTEEEVYVVTKTLRVIAKSYSDALAKSRCEASNSPLWAVDVKRDTEELF